MLTIHDLWRPSSPSPSIDVLDALAVEVDTATNLVYLVRYDGDSKTTLTSATVSLDPGTLLWLGADYRDEQHEGRVKVYASTNEYSLFTAASLIISHVVTGLWPDGQGVGLMSQQANARFVEFRAGSPQTADFAKRAGYALLAQDIVPGTWQDWTPTVTQSGSVSVTVTQGRYMTIGDTAIVQVSLSVTGTGTAGNAVVIGGQPAAIQSANNAVVLGHAWISDISSANYAGVLVAIGATDWRVVCHTEADYAGTDPSFALASGDAIRFHAAYERA